jgi:hypothetical protein
MQDQIIDKLSFGSMTANEVGKAVGVEKPEAITILQGMAEAGLVRRLQTGAWGLTKAGHVAGGKNKLAAGIKPEPKAKPEPAPAAISKPEPIPPKKRSGKKKAAKQKASKGTGPLYRLGLRKGKD